MRTSPRRSIPALSALSLGAALSLSMMHHASARSYRVTQVPNNTWGCGLCHQGASGGPRNPFGLDVGATLNGADVNWSAICDLDSDGDGYTNGEELGDPSCMWVTGNPNPPGPTYGPHNANDYPMPEPPPPPMGGEPMGGEPLPPMGGEPMGGEPMGGEPPPPIGGEPMGGEQMGGEPLPPMGGEPITPPPMGGEPMEVTPTPMGGTPDPYRPTYGPISNADEVEGGCESNPGRSPLGALLTLFALIGLMRSRESA